MALDKQTIPIRLGIGGVDTRSDVKAIAPPKLAALTNGVFTTPSSVRKRFGGSALATQEWQKASGIGSAGAAASISGARLLATLDDELLLADADALYSYSNAYWQKRGGLSSFQARYESYRPSSSTNNAVLASTSDLIVHAWESYEDGIGYDIRYAVFDAATGGVIISGQLAFDAGGNVHTRPSLFAIGTTVYLFGVQASANKLKMVTITRDGGSVTKSSTVDVVSNVNATTPVYDIRVNAAGTGFFLAYNSSTATTIKHGGLTTGGVFTSNDRSTTSAVTVLGLCVEAATGNYAVFWGMDGNNTVTATIFNSSSVQVLAPTVISNTETDPKHQITGAYDTARLHIIYGLAPVATPGRLRHAGLTTAGVLTAPVTWFRQSVLVTHAWVHNDFVYAGFIAADVNENKARQNIFVGRCSTVPGSEAEIGVASSAPDRRIVAGGLVPLATTRKETEMTIAHVQTVTANARYRFPIVFIADGTKGRAIKQIDLLNTEVAPFVQAGQCVYQPGAGGLWQYDGQWITESGFWMYPPDPTASTSAGGSMDASANYGYRVYYEWYNAKGERERSSSGAVTVATTASNFTVVLSIRPLVHTNKVAKLGVSPVSIVVYRTLGGESDAYYRASSSNPTTNGSTNGYIINDPTVDTITWTDNQSDAVIAVNETDYLSAGELENIAPAPCTVSCIGNGRVFVAGFDDPNLVRYSKQRGTGVALTFNEALQSFIDSGLGPITGLAMLKDNLIVFRERSIIMVAGDGFNNTGTETTQGPPTLISDEIGCISQRSILNIPAGVIFQSKKGLYLITGGGLEYIGADVESYNSQTVLAAVVIPGSEEIRLTMSGGATLLYDYAAGQWSVWTIGGLDACVWQSLYVRLVDATGAAHKEVASQFHDNNTTYSMIVKTPWIALDGLQGFQRVYRAMVLGEFMSGHKIRVKVYYDYKTTADDTYTWDATSVVTGTAIYQFVIPFHIQKCEAIQLEFEDIVDSVATALRESYRLTELMLEVGIKGGTFDEGANRRATY